MKSKDPWTDAERKEMEHLRGLIHRSLKQLEQYNATEGPLVLIENEAILIVGWCKEYFRILNIDGVGAIPEIVKARRQGMKAVLYIVLWVVATYAIVGLIFWLRHR